ncbi:MAG: hypothetical protein JWQ44_1253 [Chthoniobacter sp.]|jgi:hypothetical protein|nr:hypothetical protein [Chthoniobacter sp.]
MKARSFTAEAAEKQRTAEDGENNPSGDLCVFAPSAVTSAR